MVNRGYSFARRTIATVATAALLAASPSALAQDAGSVQDLVGARGGSGEGDLESRGFVYSDGHKDDWRSFAYYWHPRSKRCIQVTTQDGRFQRISNASNSDCHQKDGGVSTGGAVAIGAAALIGGLLLAHKSGHHDDNQHYGDAGRESQYERGFRDGQYGQSYHNYDRSDDYARGFEAGTRQAHHDTGYRQSYGGGYGGYRRAVSVSDLKGTDSIRAIDSMSERGFRDVDSITSGNTQYGVFWQPETRQCVQLTMADRRVYDARDIGTHPKCR